MDGLPAEWISQRSSVGRWGSGQAELKNFADHTWHPIENLEKAALWIALPETYQQSLKPSLGRSNSSVTHHNKAQHSCREDNKIQSQQRTMAQLLRTYKYKLLYVWGKKMPAHKSHGGISEYSFQGSIHTSFNIGMTKRKLGYYFLCVIHPVFCYQLYSI